MTTLQIPSRPFASEQITGLALPDGIFEIAFGQLTINAHLQNGGHATVTGTSVYLESVSDPGIVVVPATQPIPHLPPGGARLVRWRADFTRATPGKTRISFVTVDASGARTRIVQEIFVTRTTFDARTNTVAMQTPEGVLRAGFPVLVRPVDDGCCGTTVAGSGSGIGGGLGGGGGTGTGGGGGGAAGYGPGSGSSCGCGCGCPRSAAVTKPPLAAFRRDANPLPGILQAALRGEIQLCPTWYLPQGIGWVWEPTPPYAGQYGELPFQALWWKVLLCVIAVVLVLAASIVSSGAVTLGNGDPSETVDVGAGQTCCGLAGGGTRSNYVAAGLVAAAAACVTATALGGARDPIRLGQAHTPPGPGKLTVAERMYAELSFREPVVLGKPFAVATRWAYTRTTTASEHQYATHDVHQNVHVLSRYEVAAPDLNHAFREEPWICRARFWDADGEPMTGPELFVQCFLIGPCAQVIRVVLQDDGTAGDGTYTGLHRFTREAEGLWKYLVIAQDVNNAQSDLTPEQAAQIIGGIVLTHQLTISFDGGTCRLVPDGYVNVIGGLG
ncbi:MAG TPA: hypothetical protein VHW23_31045 [Kofleriaceae bacterium]|nr:hypothetical protein [Kofleriaceae bacterium]